MSDISTEDFQKQKACLIIRNYLEDNNLPYNFTDDEIYEKYYIAAVQLIKNSENLEKVRDGVGVTSQKQGDRSTNFADGVEAWTITEDIKALLPSPNNFQVW